MRTVIKLEHVSKKFSEEQVLKDVCFEFQEGKIYGIVGNNGSGKTVLMKCICGFLNPSSGKILVNYKEIGKDVDFPEDIGVIIETPGFLPNLTGMKNLEILASLQHKIGKERIQEVLQTVGLDPKLKKPVSKYSLGMRQRLGIAQAVMEDPSILILDEPFNGLDKKGVKQMHELILSLKGERKTILLSSHSQNDIDVLCDTVCEMDAGTMTCIRERAGERDEMCLEMCKITRWERGYRLILDRVDFSVHKKEKVLIRGKIQEDTRQMFQVASGVTAVQEGTYRISRAGIIPEQFPDLERMRAIDYLLLPLLTQGYNRKQAWGRIKPMVKTSTLWEKRMIYADNLTAYEKGVLLSIAALSTEPEIVLAGDGISEMTEEERKKFGTLISGWLADLGMAFVAFGNLWEGILYFDRIYEIQNGHLLEIHNTREGKG